MEKENERTSADFFNDFDGIMKIHKENLPKTYRILPSIRLTHIGTEKKEFTAENAEEIVNGIRDGDRKMLRRIPNLRNYISEVFNDFRLRTTDKRNWDYYYPYEEDEEFRVDVYTIELNMIPVLKQLMRDLEKPVSSFFGIMRPTEMMAIESISRQKRLPYDVAERVLSPYIGKKPVGGRKRTRHCRRGKRNKSVKKTR